MSNTKQARELLETSINAVGGSPADYELFELKELLVECKRILEYEADTQLELSGGEVRIIDGNAIGEIWADSLIEQTKDCYEGLSNLPSFVAIDWEQTAENCKADGMGHHFAGYDGEEHSAAGMHIFRIN